MKLKFRFGQMKLRKEPSIGMRKAVNELRQVYALCSSLPADSRVLRPDAEKVHELVTTNPTQNPVSSFLYRTRVKGVPPSESLLGNARI